ncbi:MAG: JAB domain-containing protein [Pseudomonadota bacterium]|nr:JAB domain-containing protein [Pseudomonadota bacterium]
MQGKEKSAPVAMDRFHGIDAEALNAAERRSVVALALKALEADFRPGASIARPDDAREYLRLRLAGEAREVFGAMFLSTRHAVIATEHLFHGTIDSCSVYPRVVVQRALAHNAAAVMLFHNHPSGETTPSGADTALTAKLRDALALVDVRLLDHLVVSSRGTASLAELNLL